MTEDWGELLYPAPRSGEEGPRVSAAEGALAVKDTCALRAPSTTFRLLRQLQALPPLRFTSRGGTRPLSRKGLPRISPRSIRATPLAFGVSARRRSFPRQSRISRLRSNSAVRYAPGLSAFPFVALLSLLFPITRALQLCVSFSTSLAMLFINRLVASASSTSYGFACAWYFANSLQRALAVNSCRTASSR